MEVGSWMYRIRNRRGGCRARARPDFLCSVHARTYLM
jgi:hypothetical protein